MKALLIVPLILVVKGLENNDDGRYVPDNSGQYIPDNSGQYIPDFSGRYIDDGTGRYSFDDSGRFQGDKNGFLQRNLQPRDNSLDQASSARNSIHLKPSRIERLVQKSPPISPNPYQNNNYQNGKWKIIRQLNDIDADGYHWEYETENKILAEESGKIHNKGTDKEAMRAKGSFSYTGPDNVLYSVQYTADENGFVPVGNHLPTPPPIPPAIAKALNL